MRKITSFRKKKIPAFKSGFQEQNTDCSDNKYGLLVNLLYMAFFTLNLISCYRVAKNWWKNLSTAGHLYGEEGIY